MDAPREYVVGFAFAHDFKRVLLIRKTHPKWQAGKLNGTGGRVEPGETVFSAMAREHLEETGQSIPNESWNLFATISGNNVLYAGELERDPNALFFKVYFFWAKHEIDNYKRLTEEKPEIVSIIHLPWMGEKLVSAVGWLVPMALSMATAMCKQYEVTEHYV